MEKSAGVATIGVPSSIAGAKSIRPNVTVVCGPQGSGKTDLVLDRMEDGDFVWDYGEVQRALFPKGEEGNASRIMGEIKTAVFRHLHSATAFKNAWLVVQAPSKNERQTYIDRLDAKIVVIEATAGTCGEENRNAAIKWWSKYERVPGQEIILCVP